MKIKSLIAGLMATALSIGGSAQLAWAEEETPDSVVVGGVEYGPEDGLIEELETFEIEPGMGPVGMMHPEGFTPQATWGTSYAISTETLQLHYSAKGKAAGNVYQGKRYIRVCFWYERDGKRLTSEKCSAARDVGGNRWTPGSEVTDSVWDTLNPVAPKTEFHIRTTKINP